MNNKMLIVTHGSLGKALIEVAKKVIGEIKDDCMISVSNENLSTSELADRIRLITDSEADSFYIIATDFPGGSCFIASRKVASSSKRISSVSGINISMVLSFLTKKELYQGPQLTEIIKTDGNRAIIS
jgi:mannose/fructose-specific phosphotransferase system component IIA